MGHGLGQAHRLTKADRLELRRRVRAGESHRAAPRAVGCSAKSVQRLPVKTGGIKSRAKPLSPFRLSLSDREEISRGLLAGESCRVITTRLGRAPSTISREVAAGGARAQYRAWRADDTAHRRAHRPQGRRSSSPIRGCARNSSAGSSAAGRRSRSPRDCAATFPPTWRCVCPMRRSINRCSSKGAVHPDGSSRGICARGESCDALTVGYRPSGD